MKRLHIQLTPDFNEDLLAYMQLRGIRTRAEAVRTAVREALLPYPKPSTDFASWIGSALGSGENPKPRFFDHAEVWNK